MLGLFLFSLSTQIPRNFVFLNIIGRKKQKFLGESINTYSQFFLNNLRNSLNFSTNETYYKHVGIYGYRKDILRKICQLPPSKNEIKENLEQLRWLDNNYKIKIGITKLHTISVDTTEDIEKIKAQSKIK